MVTHIPSTRSVSSVHMQIQMHMYEIRLYLYLYLYFVCPFNNINLWYYATCFIHCAYGGIFYRSGDNIILTTDIDTEIC